MGFNFSLFSFSTAEKRSGFSGLSAPKNWLLKWMGLGDYATKKINVGEAQTLSALYNGVRMISEQVSIMPRGVFSRDNDSRKRNNTHPADRIISVRANPYINNSSFFEFLIASALLRGGGLALISRDAAYRPTRLDLVHPDSFSPYYYQGTLYWRISGIDGLVDHSEVIFIPGPQWDGKNMKSFLAYAADSLRVSIEAQKMGVKLFENNGVPPGIIKSEKELDDDNMNKLGTGWSERLKQGKTPILEDGTDWKSLMINPADAQFLETRGFGVEEVARWLNIPLNKLKQLSKSSYNSLEQQNLEWVIDTLRPWITRMEEELTYKLLFESEQGKEYVRINMNSLMRGDMKTRTEYYRVMLEHSVFDIDTVLALEDMNPLPDGLGKIRTIPANYMPLDKAQDFYQSIIDNRQADEALKEAQALANANRDARNGYNRKKEQYEN